ncbi:MAG: hypothetical protein ACLFR0_04400 [Alphaproteobacteria bacterium]
MAFGTHYNRLNFHFDEIYKTMVDKKNGLKISLGLVSGLRGNNSRYMSINKGFTVSFQEQGMPQNELDILCNKMAEQAQSLGIDVLLTKSDLPFDNRWFVMGDLRGLIEAARQDKIFMPLSDFLYEGIIVELEDYEDRWEPEE